MARYALTAMASLLLVASGLAPAQAGLQLSGDSRLELALGDEVLLRSPAEGLWSIAVNADVTRPLRWLSAGVERSEQDGPWTIRYGRLVTEKGDWLLRDACRDQDDRIHCVRRWEWHGQETLADVVLSVRWQANAPDASVFQPGLMYYGNPAGKKNSLVRAAHLSGQPGELAQWEEHRYPMPFTALEWRHDDQWRGAALHSLPSPAAHARRVDQWWSLGMEHFESFTELRLLSGPTGYNGERGVIKLYQQASAPYDNATLEVPPGAVIEKTFWLQAYPVKREGDGFRTPLHTSVDIFQPWSTDGMPTWDDIIEAKLRYTGKRWAEGRVNGRPYAGFNMYDPTFRRMIVMGWAGQSDAPGFYLLHFGREKGKSEWVRKATRAMDFLSTAPRVDEGFNLRFDMDSGEWSRQDHVSQGQTLFMFAKAIETAREMTDVDSGKWEAFFRQSADFHASRILAEDWRPVSTNEAFHVAPLALGFALFGERAYREAAIKAAEHYAGRHLDMREPYWGGTLDARGEDKEGAWAALQAFMAVYDLTGDSKYLEWARHAGDVVLSYTMVWDIPMPAGRLADHGLKTRGWTFVSPQNHHLDVYGVLTTPWIWRLGELTGDDSLIKLARLMYLSCGQMIDPYGSQGEQLQETNYVQGKQEISAAGPNPEPWQFRGGYSEDWTVLWITAHFLTAAAILDEMGVTF